VCSAKGEHRWRLTKDRVKGEKNTGKGDGKSLPQILFLDHSFSIISKELSHKRDFSHKFLKFHPRAPAKFRFRLNEETMVVISKLQKPLPHRQGAAEGRNVWILQAISENMMGIGGQSRESPPRVGSFATFPLMLRSRGALPFPH
jgi:hypothetical protein